jgi:hypothetical protein
VYSPETLLQLHHLRHDELVAAAAQARAHRAARSRRAPGVGGGVARSSRAAVAGARRLVVGLRAASPARPGRVPAGGDPICCPA